MRLLAWVRDNPEVVRVVVYAGGDGAYLFHYDSPDDGNTLGDFWFESLADAKSAAAECYGVLEGDWLDVGDPLVGCQHDWLFPARVPGRAEGAPRFGELELFFDGAWQPVAAGGPRVSILARWPPASLTPREAER